jgi:hypothetical protein
VIEAVANAVPIAGASYVACDAVDRDSARDAVVELLIKILDSIPEPSACPT